MKDFEKYITENTEKFDYAEPSDGHFSKFKDKLDLKKPRISLIRNDFFRIAASFIILFGISISLYFTLNNSKSENNISAPNYSESEQYYLSVIDLKIEEIRDLIPANRNSKDQKEVSEDIDEVEKSFFQVNDQTDINTDSEYTYSISILCLQQKIEVLDNILTHLKNANSIIN